MPMIEFRTFGTLDLRGADGRELHSLLAQPKRVALLAYLCIAQPRGFQHRDTLLGLFWPSADQDHARTSLRRALYILRRALGDDAIVSRGDEEVTVDFERVSCDAAVFEQSLKANRTEEALELYRGDLLTGFFIDEAPEFERWLQSERSRLRECAARAAYAMSNRLESSGDFGAALILARRSLELSDTDERALRKVMELQCKAGDRTGAIQAYETFARHLAAEYEGEPSSDTRSLIEQIRSGREQFGRETEMKAAVQSEFAEPLNDPSFTPSGARGAAKGKGRIRRVRGMWYAVTALAILISATAIWGWMRPAPSKHVKYTLALDSSMVHGEAWVGRVAISPDGSRLAYLGGSRAQILVLQQDSLHPIAIPMTEGANTPFFSPDGRHMGFVIHRTLQFVTRNGGPPIIVTDTLVGLAGDSWGLDGYIYADAEPTGGLLRVEAKAGAAPKWFTALDTARGEIDHTQPDVLPNGKGVLFTVESRGKTALKGATSFAVAVADIPSGKHRVIVNAAMYARYAAPGHLVYVTTNGTLMIAPFDQNSMEITGDATALDEGIRHGVAGSADLAVSEEGTLVYVTSAGQGNQEFVWVTRDGKAQPVDPDWQGDFGHPALSPDGTRLAVTRTPSGYPGDIWIKPLDRGSAFKLTLDGKVNYGSAWTPDGNSVTFSSASPTGVLWTKRADGSAQTELPLHEKRWVWAPLWSPDGKWVIFVTGNSAPGSADILGIRPGIDSAPVPLVHTKFMEVAPALSPDGRWLAYTSDETGQFEIYVVPFPNTSAAKWAVSTRGGTEPLWSHRGSELFYRDGSGNLVAVEVKITPTFSFGRPTLLFPASGFASEKTGLQYALAPNDQRFLMIRPLPDKLIVVKNWFEELNAKSRK